MRPQEPNTSAKSKVHEQGPHEHLNASTCLEAGLGEHGICLCKFSFRPGGAYLPRQMKSRSQVKYGGRREIVPAGALQDKNGGLVRGGTRRGDVQDRSPGEINFNFRFTFPAL